MKNNTKAFKNENLIENANFELLKNHNNCLQCKSERVKYWDETEAEIIYKCLDCSHFYTIPLNKDKLNIYFSF